MGEARTRHDRWLDLAHRLAWAFDSGGNGPYRRKEHAARFFDVAEAVSTGLERHPAGWDAAFAERIAAERFRMRTHATGRQEVKSDIGDCLSLKALRLAYAVAYDAPGPVGRHDLLALARALDRLPGHGDDARRMRAHAGCRTSTPTDARQPVRFAVPFFTPAATGYSPVRRAEGTFILARVEARDAPVVAVLSTPAGKLALRSTADGLLRPLLTPGSWEPLRVGDLGEALSGASCWADHPMADQDRWLPPPAQAMPAAPARDRRGDTPAADAVAAALARAGTLSVVDGVVHRSTGTPRLTLVATSAMDGEEERHDLSLGWSTGDLSSWDAQDIGAHVHGTGGSWDVWRDLTIPLAGPATLDRVVDEWERLAGEPMPRARAHPPVAWLDPSLAPDEADALDAFAGSVQKVSKHVDGHAAMLAAVGPALEAFRAGEPPLDVDAGGMAQHAALPAAVARALAATRAEAVARLGSMSTFVP